MRILPYHLSCANYVGVFCECHESWEVMLFHSGEGLSAGFSIASVSHFSPGYLGTNFALLAWCWFCVGCVVSLFGCTLVPRSFAIIELPL